MRVLLTVLIKSLKMKRFEFCCVCFRHNAYNSHMTMTDLCSLTFHKTCSVLRNVCKQQITKSHKWQFTFNDDY